MLLLLIQVPNPCVWESLTTTAQHEPLSEWTVRDHRVHKINVNGFSSYGVGFPPFEYGVASQLWLCLIGIYNV